MVGRAERHGIPPEDLVELAVRAMKQVANSNEWWRERINDLRYRLEVVRIPFEGGEIVGYLRLPANASRPVPLVLAISGLDSRKETVAETYAAALRARLDLDQHGHDADDGR